MSALFLGHLRGDTERKMKISLRLRVISCPLCYLYKVNCELLCICLGIITGAIVSSEMVHSVIQAICIKL